VNLADGKIMLPVPLKISTPSTYSRGPPDRPLSTFSEKWCHPVEKLPAVW
jgi:hypothetical protein